METSAIENIICILAEQKPHNYNLLECLAELCECKGAAIGKNQTFIVKQLQLSENKDILYPTRLDHEKKFVEVSTDRGQSFYPLHAYIKEDCEMSDELNFFRAQLDLYGKLCLGRNTDAIKFLREKLDFNQCLVGAKGPELSYSLAAEYGFFV